MSTPHAARRYHVGPEFTSPDFVDVRVWAPTHQAIEVLVDGRATSLARGEDGYHGGRVAAAPGERYGFRIQNDPRVYPDPASRSQPDGPEGLSELVDLQYPWTDHEWPGLVLDGQVIYEMHVGTFTPDGTWDAATSRLPDLSALGVTVIQMMPIGEFAGSFGWGYDGVFWFAPMHGYGRPCDLQRFVDAAHRNGIGVILDVVYNHLGPSGNVLPTFSPFYETDRYANEWGVALNFDGEHSTGMRDLVVANAEYWIREFHVDGFRIDAAQQIFDQSDVHILRELATRARAAATPRGILLTAEHEPQHAALVRSAEGGGLGLDAVYNEDFHHSVKVALTGMREAYLSDYSGESREWLAAVRRGFLFQGQHYPWQKATRGRPALDIPAARLVAFMENHDQVANSLTGHRLIDQTSPKWWRAMSALLLLGPWTPFIFQGQERGTRQAFHYFADHEPSLQTAVVKGRGEFLSQFGRVRSVPADSRDRAIGREAFESSRLDMPACQPPAWHLYRDLLALRRQDGTLGQGAPIVDGIPLGDRTLLLRFFGRNAGADRLMVVNLASDLDIASLSDPLVAPPADSRWSPLWCSEDIRYGGHGVAAMGDPPVLTATGHATTIYKAEVWG